MKEYIGIPYVDKGRSFKGCDCFGLVKLFYKNKYNLNVPDVAITAAQPRRIFANFLNEISENWEEIPTPQVGCVIAMAIHQDHPRLITHFAVMVNEKQVIHTLEKIGSHILDINDPKIKPFIKGFYKWRY